MEKILMIGVGAINIETDKSKVIYLPLSDISHVEKINDSEYMVLFRDDCYARKFYTFREVIISPDDIQTISSVR